MVQDPFRIGHTLELGQQTGSRTSCDRIRVVPQMKRDAADPGGQPATGDTAIVLGSAIGTADARAVSRHDLVPLTLVNPVR
jgi:hypothetical protein